MSDVVARLREWADQYQQSGEYAMWPSVEMIRGAANEIERLSADLGRLEKAMSRENDEICQTLGKVLGYPWFKDDPTNFPGATEADGVCVGEHVAASLAEEAAKALQAKAALPRREMNCKIADAIVAAIDGQPAPAEKPRPKADEMPAPAVPRPKVDEMPAPRPAAACRCGYCAVVSRVLTEGFPPSDEWHIRCTRCFQTFIKGDTREAAVAEWNRQMSGAEEAGPLLAPPREGRS